MQKNVLLIESDAAFARAMTAALESRGFGVRTSPDGKEGIELARALHPDCVVLCVELPGLSGYSWCNRLKKDQELKAIPLVITSSEATPETFEQHRKLKTHAEDYLIKPFDPEALVERVGALVGMPDPADAPDEDLVTLEDVELEGVAAAATPAEDDDLRQLDDAFDHISRGADEPSSGLPGSPGSEPPLTLLPEADESPPLLDLDKEVADALASLAEETASAPSNDPFATKRAPAPRRAPSPPRPVAFASPPPPVSADEDETPVLLEEVEVLEGGDEAATAALRAAHEEADALRIEAESLRADAEALRAEAETLRTDAGALRTENGSLRSEVETARAEASGRGDEIATLRAEVDRLAARAGEAEGRADALARDREVAAGEATTLREEIEALRRERESSAAEIAALRAEADASREEAGGLRAEADALRVEADRLRAEAALHADEASRVRGDWETHRAEAEAARAAVDSARLEAEDARAQADAARADAEARAGSLAEQVPVLEAQITDLEDRVLAAYTKIKSDEKVREKTRRALAMVLQILDEKAPGEGGSTPPAA